MRVSRTLVLANAVGHLLAGAALVAVAIDVHFVGIVLLPLVYHARSMYRRIALRHPAAWQSVRWTLDNRLRLTRVNGRHEVGECVVARCWGAAWVQLTVRLSGRRLPRFVVLPADALDAASHRRLRVRSRIRAPQHLASEPDTV